jgi:capsular polysaccharide transport system permease protein
VATTTKLHAYFAGLRLPASQAGLEGEERAARYLTALRHRTSLMRMLFSIMVVLPTAAGAVYYGLIASKRYVSEAEFIVRGVDSHQSSKGIAALLSTFGLTRSVDDTYAVQNFMQSRDAVRLLEERLPLRAMFSRKGADFIARFPHFWRGDSFERLYEYFQERVTILQDQVTAISNLKVDAFTPEDSKAIASELLRLGEEMVNRMNARAERDTVENARSDVELAETKLIAAQADLTAFRNHELLIDPSQYSAAMLGTITQLSSDLANTSIQIGQTASGSPSSPAIQPLQARAAALQQGIGKERGKMAGDDTALAGKVSAFERLTLLRDLADKSFSDALHSLDAARQDARRQKIYIETIVAPNLADEDTEPERARSVLTIFVLSFAIFAMVWLVLAGAKEHAQ